MSGSNAIAAAKRRRGVNEINKGPQQSQSSQNQSSQPPSQIHPLQLVMINHERLNKMSSEFSQLPQALDSLGENFNALSSNCDFLHEKLETLEKNVSGLLTNGVNTNKSIDSNSGELSNKLNLLEGRVNELFKQFSTLQNFMLELSLTVNGVKEKLNDLNKHDISHTYQLPSHVSTELNGTNDEPINSNENSNVLSQDDLQNIKLSLN